ncbi:Glu-tRNA(Gln) amidotransferase subunit GatD [Candidatus Marsarchaeota archaeon]|nr:Glu-tRNA(Gln) amidotransferase subunit GatD [Candidatus Marsarchaeota archaeon]
MYNKKLQKIFDLNSIRVGDLIKIEPDNIEGELMPKPDYSNENTIIIKLKSGYNVGIEFKNSTKITKIKNININLEFPKSDLKQNKSLPNISLIYTGGTIGSKIDYKTGGVHMLLKPEELFYEVPELSDIANINVENLFSIASEDMTFIEWKKIAEHIVQIVKKNKDTKGIIITHGTDTMHYTASALSFMLTNLNIPIVLTGSQRSSDRGSSDAFMNLICSSYIASRSDIAEVGICMHSSSNDDYCSFIRGVKARKLHTSRRDAFKAVNDKPLAYVKLNGEIKPANEYKKKSDQKQNTIDAKTNFDNKVALLKIYPNANPDIINYYIEKKYNGIIIEGTGLGHIPVSGAHKELRFLDNIKKAIDSNIIIGITSQCLFGRVNPYVYRNLRLLSDLGAIYCEDMLPETAYVKLGWLLGNYKKEQSKELLNKNLAGEIKERTEFDDEFI